MRGYNVLTRFQKAGFLLLIILSFLTIQFPAFGDSKPISNSEAIFKEANNAYQKGDFTKAAELYRQLYEEGYFNGNLLYNLGNTHFKLGAKGGRSFTMKGRNA
ncbi:MAG: hypothetical protein ACM3YE_01730 [Bacteroidota bacterium]